MIQGGSDHCDPPPTSEGLDQWFAGPCRRVAVDGIGHFPHREAGQTVAELVDDHLGRHL